MKFSKQKTESFPLKKTPAAQMTDFKMAVGHHVGGSQLGHHFLS